MDKQKTMEDRVRMFYGLPPYNTPGNIVYLDGYFASAFKTEYGKTIEQAKKDLGL